MELTQRDSWKKLEKQAESMRWETINELNQKNASREQTLGASFGDITLDYSHQVLDDTILHNLISLAKECHLPDMIQGLITGAPLNLTENKPALHTALRTQSDEPLVVNHHNIIPDILKTRNNMYSFARTLREGQWLGATGKPITHIINIGIGGSQLGPLFCITALNDLMIDTLHFHFISDLDPTHFDKVTAKLNPETTLFIVSSKSFTTHETLYNANKAIAWIKKTGSIDQHMIAITAHTEKANALGIANVLPIWDWVGGRFSLCSAINLITCIAIGPEHFAELLEGAHAMDVHFSQAPFQKNLPVLLALIGIWNNNFLNRHQLLLLSYAQDLAQFPAYIQQLDMESNGKSIDKQGKAVHYATGPLVWGGLGNQSQHSYYQLLCQGTHKITADLISIDTWNNETINQLCLAHKRVLTQGVFEESNPIGFIPGNTPLNHISITSCSPRAIGALVALYEHKIFTQGIIWNINSFDQPGVESSKKIFKDLFLTDKKYIRHYA